jgi:type 1 glutamine amidotransferase
MISCWLQNRYIVFPPEGPRPPSGTQAEVIEGLKKLNPSPQTMELVEEILAEQKMRREERERVKQLTAAAQAGASVVACNDAGAADASANAPKQTWTQWIMGYPATK